MVETFPHAHDVLTVVYRPDGKQLACSTLDGQIHFWDPIDGLLMFTIEGRRDIAGGRLMTDRRSAANSTSGKCFTSLCYSADGNYILAGGSSKYICMYDVADQVCLNAFTLAVCSFVKNFSFTIMPTGLLHAQLCSTYRSIYLGSFAKWLRDTVI